MIYLTSFFQSKNIPKGTEIFSAAVYQPSGYDFPKAHWADIRKFGKVWTRPRDFIDTPDPMIHYRAALYELYMSRKEQIESWTKAHPIAALCCWCPYDKAAQRQIKEYGSFICHTGVIGEMLSQEFKVPVWYDSDRRTMTTLARGTLNAVQS